MTKEPDDLAAFDAIETLYHSYLTGFILTLVSRAGPAKAADAVFRTFRRQQLARCSWRAWRWAARSARRPQPDRTHRMQVTAGSAH